ncbi:MAG: hypothetical protein ACRD5F_03525 [Candidatus Acidiferrales bacterium]
MKNSLDPEPQPKRGFPVALAIGAGVVAVLVAAAWFVMSRSGGETAAQPLPFGPEEQRYAERIHFRDFQLSRAENMLGQEVTFIECTVENAGTAVLRELEVVLEFYNLENQPVFSERRRLLGRYEAPLGGGRSRRVSMNFETLPADWNQRAPVTKVTGLVLER